MIDTTRKVGSMEPEDEACCTIADDGGKKTSKVSSILACRTNSDNKKRKGGAHKSRDHHHHHHHHLILSLSPSLPARCLLSLSYHFFYHFRLFSSVIPPKLNYCPSTRLCFCILRSCKCTFTVDRHKLDSATNDALTF
ncbi:uncharacterized protein BP01DRAFT_198083 [Aspergillus saccharolyticus JOP 1030-1]|uniref:Uncharacterized protein n=1 Tax=Aspergillus saccharolyticus JOP 1030-1 TaxID=1450539 RepID=A0A318ZUW5_9EURO|nr:hypothetical protein BP01DRAFT_198083 [Aspergillus saccharolyticus JOP 1030-1]PYH47800.1 hypothetical protein BP01DRAFT_198083 [Aspergillus saccharolyticus JOP 1030-1]